MFLAMKVGSSLPLLVTPSPGLLLFSPNKKGGFDVSTVRRNVPELAPDFLVEDLRLHFPPQKTLLVLFHVFLLFEV